MNAIEAMRPLKALVHEYIEEQKKQGKSDYSQAHLAKAIGLSPTVISKYVSGKATPSKNFLSRLLKHIYNGDEAKILEKRREIHSASKPTEKGRTASFEDFVPCAAAFEFEPFMRQNDRACFTDKVLRRLFDLADKPFEIDFVERFDDMFKWVDDPRKPQNMLLHISETIPRSVELFTFHSPVAAPLNIVLPILPNGKTERERISDRFVKGENIKNHRFCAVKGEIGDSYLREALKTPDDQILSIPDFAPQSIAKNLLRNGMIDGRDEVRLFIADEFLCLQVAEQLNLLGRSITGTDHAYGFLFPLGTMAVARSDRFARIPTYKYGLFSVPRQMDGVIQLLKQSLNTLFDNERFFVALAFKDLAEKLTAMVERCVKKLPEIARDELESLHGDANEYFQFSSRSDEFALALALRVTRQAMRLNTQLIQTDDDLNLRWRPILELVRNRMLGPLPLEYRDLRFDQATVQCITQPPFLTGSIDKNDPLETIAAPASRRTLIADWGLFGPVLAQITDLINLEDTELVRREGSVPEVDKAAMNLPHDLVIGTLDLPRRAYDQHFFRFPVSFRLNALVPPKWAPDASPKARSRRDSESKEFGSTTDSKSAARRNLRGFFANQTPPDRSATRTAMRAALDEKSLIPIVLKNTAAHYLCWDWDQHPEFIPFDPVQDNLEALVARFIDKFRGKRFDFERSKAVPMIIADDLTCFRIHAGISANEADLLFQPCTQDRRTRYFHSIGVQRSQINGWWEIMREMLPAAIGKSEAELAAQMNKLRKSLESEAQQFHLTESLTESAVKSTTEKWLDDVFCKDFVSPSGTWNDDLLPRAWQSVLHRLDKA
jgi:transcriptional regulator with XRE-family HTH domain